MISDPLPKDLRSSGFLDGPAGADALPRSFEEAERTAERIASAARAIAGIILATGLMAALLLVPDADRDILIPRLLIALGVMSSFVALAILSYWASRANPYRPWLAYVFATGDAVVILTGLQVGMWLSGHPGQFSFAQPGMWLIPVAIAIQSVRFRIGPLIFAATLYVLEIAGLVMFGGTYPGPDVPTGSLAALFAVPADAIRALMLVIASLVLVLSVRSKRDILLRGLHTARREAALSRFLPTEVSKRLGRDTEPGAHAEQRVLAILFIDLIGFTRESENAEPAVIAGWLAEFRERINALVSANGGFVDKFIGDGVMAIFGYECDRETAAAQACRVVDGLAAAMADWQTSDPSAPAFQAAAGGALGSVFVGVIGAGDRREFTVIGDTVNVAARLEGFAKENRALAALTHDLLDGAGLMDRLGSDLRDLPIRGRSEPVRACLVPRRPD